MIKKIRNSIGISILLLIALVINVSAEEASILGSLDISYQYDRIPLPGLSVSIYQVATKDEEGVYQYTENFSTQTAEIDKLSSSELRGLSKELVKYIKDKNIESSYQEKTESNGTCKFRKLEAGIYLIETIDYQFENKVYTASPLLVTIPQKYGEDKYEYDVSVEAKTEVIKEENNNTNNEDNNTTPSPSTYDAIVLYVGIFIVCILGLCIVVYYINKKEREYKNEKKS